MKFKSQARLVAISGSLAGETLYSDQDIISIGRDSVNDIQLKDSSVSRCHCVIRRQSIPEPRIWIAATVLWWTVS